MTDKCEAAFEDFKKGMKYKEIATKHGVTESAVKSWATRYWKVATKEKKVATINKLQLKSRGAPIGNKNAVGAGAPPRNTNSFKHGLYSSIYFDTLDEEEQRLISEINFDDEEEQLIDQIKLLAIRERRLLKSINEKKEIKNGLSLDGVIKRTLEIQGSLARGGVQKHTEITTKTISVIELIMRMETELTRIQSKKTKCIEAINRLRTGRQKINKELNGDEIANDWINAIISEQEDG